MSEETQVAPAVEDAASQILSEEAPAPAGGEDEGSSFVDNLDKTFSDIYEEGEESKPTTPVEEGKPEETAATSEKEEVSIEEETRGMTPNAGAKFKELKGELKEERTKITGLEESLTAKDQEIAELKAKLEAPEIPEDIQTKLERQEKELSAYRVEASEEYQTKVKEPIDKITESAFLIADRNGIERQLMVDILSQGDPQKQNALLKEVSEEMNHRDQNKLYGLADDLEEILVVRDRLRSNSTEVAKALEAERETATRKEQAQRREQFKASNEKVWEILRNKVPYLKGEGVDADKLMEQAATQDIQKSPLDVQAYAVASSILMPELVKQNHQLAKEIAELKGKVQEERQAEPGAGAGSPTPSATPTDGLSFLEGIESHNFSR